MNRAQNRRPSPTLMMMACITQASASSRRPEPSARAMAEEMPPPTAPAESICIIMKPGNTSAMPVSASVPSRETNHVSINPVAACASITRMFGQAMRNSVGTMRPSSKRRVRGLSTARCTSMPAAAGTGAFTNGPPFCQRREYRKAGRGDPRHGRDPTGSLRVCAGCFCRQRARAR